MMFDLTKRKKEYLIGIVLGLIAGVVLYFVQPIHWKGQALVRIGQLSQNQGIEPLSTVVERIKTHSFVLAAAKRANRNAIVGLLDVDKGSGATIKPIRNSDSLIISVVGDSQELVQTAIDSVVAELISRHGAILDAYQVDIRNELSKLDGEIPILSKQMASMPDRGADAVGKLAGGRGLLAGFEIMTMQQHLENKINRSYVLRESISSANVRPTSLIEPTSVSEQRLFSTLWRACLFGASLGLLLSVIWVRWRK